MFTEAAASTVATALLPVSFLLHVKYPLSYRILRDVVVMRFITPPNSSSSFEVSAIFWDSNFDDIRRNNL